MTVWTRVKVGAACIVAGAMIAGVGAHIAATATAGDGQATLAELAEVSKVAGKLVLAEAGKSDYAIYITPKCAAPEKFAAEQLQDYLKKMTGAELPIRDDYKDQGKAILIGPDLAAKVGIDITSEGLESPEHLKAANEAGEGFIIRSVGQRLVFAGIIPRATLYAVYEFLEQLGCRWFTAHEQDEVVPLTQDVRLDGIDFKDKADSCVAIRRYSLPITNKAAALRRADWFGKIRMNSVYQAAGPYYGRAGWDGNGCKEWLLPELAKRGVKLSLGHNELPFFYYWDQYKKIDPKKWTQRGIITRRPEHARIGCLSDEKIAARYVENMLGYARCHPEADAISLWPGDGVKLCECPKCLDPSPYDHYLKMMNSLAAKADKQGLPTIIEAIAGYASRHGGLKKEAPHPKIRLIHDGWREHWKSCRGAINWRYLRGLYPGVFWELLRLRAKDRYRGVRGVGSGGVGLIIYIGSYADWPSAMMWGYPAARLLWDKTRDPTAIRRDMIERYYGSAAEPMKNFFAHTAPAKGLPREYFRLSAKGINPKTPVADLQYRQAVDDIEEALAMAKAAKPADPAIVERIAKTARWIAYQNATIELLWLTNAIAAEADDEKKAALLERMRELTSDYAEMLDYEREHGEGVVWIGDQRQGAVGLVKKCRAIARPEQ